MYQHKPAKAGVGIGVFGVAFTFLTTALLVLIPQYLMDPATSNAYMGTWSRPIMTIGVGVMNYGIPLLSAAVAYSLTRRNHSPKSIVTGFIIGGLVFGLGDAFFTELVISFIEQDPELGQSLLGHISDTIKFGGRLIGGALVGTFFATVIQKRF